MDRRKQKTRKLIFDAFLYLLENNRYNQISVQDIIDKANVGRSTFYSHFETKDALLSAFCYQLFEHVFSKDMACDVPIEFDDKYSFEQKACHILYHFRDSKKDIRSILFSEDSFIFWNIFKEYLKRLFTEPIHKNNKLDVPVDFLENYYVESFISIIKWWISKNMQQNPETLIYYYTKIINL